jgi:tRNA 2-selenouridine synthase
MAELIQIKEFIERSASTPVIDVRAPSEFGQGHIPGAFNIPLFDDEERRVVGTTYKQVNKEAAMYAGLDYAGRKLVDLAKEGEKRAGKGKTVLLHCWRGGMRSKSMAWLFETIGLTCYLLEGGYKSYRHYVREIMAIPLPLMVVGGRTGSGKTEILYQLRKEGEQVIDLEALARHKGSAFGALGEDEQPSTEQFENDLCRVISGLDQGKAVWIEDESRNIGKCVIPGELYERMRASETIFLDIQREARARFLVKHYAGHHKDELKVCVGKIQKKLGGDRAKEAMESIDAGDFFNVAMITLQYYDKAYMHSLQKNHENYHVIRTDTVDPEANARLLINHFQRGT